MAENVVKISKKTKNNKIGLISVPSSKTDKPNTIVKSIKIIGKWDDDGSLKKKYGFSKKIMDFSNVLKRTEDIHSSSSSNSIKERPKYEDHVKTIECCEDLSKYNDVDFIILDDVYTRGITMKACRYHITKRGVDGSNLYYLVIGKTREKVLKA